MSIDPSLKMAGGLGQHRNVLSRAERITKLAESNKFEAGKHNPLGLAKVSNRRISAGKKK